MNGRAAWRLKSLTVPVNSQPRSDKAALLWAEGLLDRTHIQFLADDEYDGAVIDLIQWQYKVYETGRICKHLGWSEFAEMQL